MQVVTLDGASIGTVLTAVGALITAIGTLSGMSVMVKSNEKALEKLVEQNREDHKELFHRIEREASARIEGDREIEEKYVRVDDCDRRHAQRRSGSERRRSSAFTEKPC